MAGSKSKKVRQAEHPTGKCIRQYEQPKGRCVGQSEHPEYYYQQHPAWNFKSCDSEIWAFSRENIGDSFWTEILPYFQQLESQLWTDILVGAKKQNHSIDVSKLNPNAQKRLEQLYVEQDSLISLRLNGTHRIYGYMSGNIFNLLWYDSNHGDNASCVCRSHKKHT